MPVYEYECQTCSEVIELWQNLSESPATNCPTCDGPVKKIISRSSFQLKGGGWYADGYSSTPEAKPKCDAPKTPSCPKAKTANPVDQ
jgi:putative FmdB family regulatory protein